MTDLNFDLNGLEPDVQEYIRDLRKEAAKYRTERNTYRGKYEDAGTALSQANEKFRETEDLKTKYEQTLTENSKLQEKVGRMSAAGEAGIFPEYERLKGASSDEWAADAKTLAEKFSGQKAQPPGVPKDPAAGKPPADVKNDPLTEAFRKRGFNL